MIIERDDGPWHASMMDRQHARVLHSRLSHLSVSFWGVEPPGWVPRAKVQQLKAEGPAASSSAQGEAAGLQSRVPRHGAYTCLASCHLGMGDRGGLAAGTAGGMVRCLDVEMGQAAVQTLYRCCTDAVPAALHMWRLTATASPSPNTLDTKFAKISSISMPPLPMRCRPSYQVGAWLDR